MKKVYKYGTGHEIPEGAIYLHTLVEESYSGPQGTGLYHYVWHYFLVEVEPTSQPKDDV